MCFIYGKNVVKIYSLRLLNIKYDKIFSWSAYLREYRELKQLLLVQATYWKFRTGASIP